MPHIDDDVAGNYTGTVRPVPVLITRLDPDLPLPSYARPGDAGVDLFTTVNLVLGPGERVAAPTGIAVALPMGYVGLIHPRSGLAARDGVTVLNAPGTIDAGYRGEIKVILHNTDRLASVTLGRGTRIAQLVLQRFETIEWNEVQRLPGSDRGEGGLGSSGI